LKCSLSAPTRALETLRPFVDNDVKNINYKTQNEKTVAGKTDIKEKL